MMSPSAIVPKLNASKKFWITFGILVWLYVVVSNIPAVWGAYALTRSGDVTMNGVSGSLWSGGASLVSVKVNGADHSLGELTWKLDVLSLFSLKPCALITTELDSQTFDGRVCVKGKNSIALSNASINFSAALVQPMLPLPVAGQFSLTLDALELSDNRLQALRGKATWVDGKIHNGNNWMTVGTLGADLVDDAKNGLSAHLVDVSSPLRLDLVAGLAYPSGTRIAGKVAMPEAYFREINAEAWLSMFAAPQPNDDQGNLVYAVDLNL
jgi:general secretion pathway protein N